jgi:uncharacterized damage-inducible protein DinB
VDIDTLKLFAKYNEITNNKMGELILKLSNEQWNTQFTGYFPSIKSLCNHIYISDFNWLKRFSKHRLFNFSKAKLFEEDIQFGTTALETLEIYKLRRGELDLYITKFISEITDEDVKSFIEYTDSHGTKHKKVFGGLILHMFNHETHHRGMISLYLEELKIENNYSNLAQIL